MPETGPETGPDTGDARIRRSGCQEAVGYEVDLSGPDGLVRSYLDIGPGHLNSQGVLHGGIVAMMLDVACGNAASAWFDPEAHPPVLTVSLTTGFVSAVDQGRVTASARASGGGRGLAYVTGELCDADGQLIATANGVFKRRTLGT